MVNDTQQIPAGYKQTDVGVIPEDWKTVRLGNLCTIYGRIGFRGYTKADIVKENEGAISVSPSNISNGNIDFSNSTYISWKKYEESPEIKIFNGDILFVKTGSTVGKTAKVSNLKQKATLNPQLIVFKKIRINSSLLSYIVKHDFFQNQIKEIVVGGAIPTLSQEQTSNLILSIPDNEIEQEKIAKVLSDIDSLISKLDQLIQKKKNIKQGAMQELLTGKRRLPGFSGEWEEKMLGDIALVRTGKKDVNEGNPKGKYPFFTCSRDVSYSDNYSFSCEAILVAGNGEVGNLHYYKGKFEAYQRTYVLSDFQINTVYLWHQMSFFFKKSLGIGTIGSSIPYIKKENIVDFRFSSPVELNEQMAIANVLNDIDEEIAALKLRRQKYSNLKQGMMQQLLTGKIRLI